MNRVLPRLEPPGFALVQLEILYSAFNNHFEAIPDGFFVDNAIDLCILPAGI